MKFNFTITRGEAFITTSVTSENVQKSLKWRPTCNDEDCGSFLSAVEVIPSEIRGFICTEGETVGYSLWMLQALCGMPNPSNAFFHSAVAGFCFVVCA